LLSATWSSDLTVECVPLALGFFSERRLDVRERGEVVHFNEEKGYGFVRPDSGEKDIFFHCNAFTRQTRLPCQGDVLEFEIGLGRDGRMAARAIELVA
jgi:cold shock CspA family protein